MTPRLHDRHPELTASLPHVALNTGSTPVRRLEGLEQHGTELWMKDDGAYGDGGWGGNKVRKLEWILPEARRRRARTILTVGGLGTNWGLATALYGREHGIGTALMLLDQPLDDHVRAQQERLKASGAALHYTHTKARTMASLPWLMAGQAEGLTLDPVYTAKTMAAVLAMSRQGRFGAGPVLYLHTDGPR